MKRDVAAAAVLVALLGPAPRAGAADGAALYAASGCAICHGDEGRTPTRDAYPRLAGQNRAYLYQQLRDIRSGRRANGQTMVMRGLVEKLDDATLAAIAEWLSTLEP